VRTTGNERVVADPGFLMRVCLQVSVPVNLAVLADLPAPAREEWVLLWAHDAVDVVGAHGDVLVYGGGPGGDRSAAFVTLSRGVAALASMTGGVRFLGVLWCAEHSPDGRPATEGELACRFCSAGRTKWRNN
jgi:hypothetical protein